jgi:hypothetical protein
MKGDPTRAWAPASAKGAVLVVGTRRRSSWRQVWHRVLKRDDYGPLGGDSQSCSEREAASINSPASAIVVVSVIPLSGQAVTKLSGPGGGSGHSHTSCRDSWAGLPMMTDAKLPPLRVRIGPSGSSFSKVTCSWNTALRPSAKPTPSCGPSGDAHRPARRAPESQPGRKRATVVKPTPLWNASTFVSTT